MYLNRMTAGRIPIEIRHRKWYFSFNIQENFPKLRNNKSFIHLSVTIMAGFIPCSLTNVPIDETIGVLTTRRYSMDNQKYRDNRYGSESVVFIIQESLFLIKFRPKRWSLTHLNPFREPKRLGVEKVDILSLLYIYCCNFSIIFEFMFLM